MTAKINWQTNELISSSELNNIGREVNRALIKELPDSLSSTNDHVLTYSSSQQRWLSKVLPLTKLKDNGNTGAIISITASTQSTGTNAFAIGNNTIAKGNNSVAEGDSTQALGASSHAMNIGTIASENYQTSIGKYNISTEDVAFIVGNGEGNNNRSNALTIDWDGNILSSGDYTYTDNGTEHTLSNKSDLDHDHDTVYISRTVDNLHPEYRQLQGNLTVGGDLTLGGSLHASAINLNSDTDFIVNADISGENVDAGQYMSTVNYWLSTQDNRNPDFDDFDSNKVNTEDSALWTAINNAFAYNTSLINDVVINKSSEEYNPVYDYYHIDEGQEA